MQKLQRKAGLLLPRSADDAQVGLLLNDFNEGDKMLKVIIEATKQFRISWTELLQHASGMATDFDSIYQFIHGDAENQSRYRPTTRDQLAKVRAFKDALATVRDVIIQELSDVERRVAGPAKDARKHIDIFRKVVKRREDRKLDFERYKSRTDALEKKSSRSERDTNALMKHRIDLEAAEKGYEVADEHLRSSLPGLTKAIYALIPRLVNAQCMIQNTLLGHYYTALHDFCQDQGYPIPSSEWRQVHSEFEDVFPQVKSKTETLSCLQRGKAVREPFHSRPDSLQTTTVSHRNGFQPMRSNSSLPAPVPKEHPTLDYSSKPTRTVSNQSYGHLSPPPSASASSFHSASDYFNKSTGPGANMSHQSSLTPRTPTTPYGALSHATSTASLASAAAAAAGKKKPPPPPPKRKPSSLQQDYVVALYDFRGSEQGDLPFREGDRIRVVKRTESTDDWWDGELNGRKGSFPANYCKAS